MTTEELIDLVQRELSARDERGKHCESGRVLTLQFERDALRVRAEKAEARVKELEAENNRFRDQYNQQCDINERDFREKEDEISELQSELRNRVAACHLASEIGDELAEKIKKAEVRIAELEAAIKPTLADHILAVAEACKGTRYWIDIGVGVKEWTTCRIHEADSFEVRWNLSPDEAATLLQPTAAQTPVDTMLRDSDSCEPPAHGDGHDRMNCFNAVCPICRPRHPVFREDAFNADADKEEADKAVLTEPVAEIPVQPAKPAMPPEVAKMDRDWTDLEYEEVVEALRRLARDVYQTEPTKGNE